MSLETPGIYPVQGRLLQSLRARASQQRGLGEVASAVWVDATGAIHGIHGWSVDLAKVVERLGSIFVCARSASDQAPASRKECQAVDGIAKELFLARRQAWRMDQTLYAVQVKASSCSPELESGFAVRRQLLPESGADGCCRQPGSRSVGQNVL